MAIGSLKNKQRIIYNHKEHVVYQQAPCIHVYVIRVWLGSNDHHSQLNASTTLLYCIVYSVHLI